MSAHVCCGQMPEWIKITTCYGGRPRAPGQIVLHGDPAPLTGRGTTASPSFRLMSIVARWVAHLSNCWALVTWCHLWAICLSETVLCQKDLACCNFDVCQLTLISFLIDGMFRLWNSNPCDDFWQIQVCGFVSHQLWGPKTPALICCLCIKNRRNTSDAQSP